MAKTQKGLGMGLSVLLQETEKEYANNFMSETASQEQYTNLNFPKSTQTPINRERFSTSKHSGNCRTLFKNTALFNR